MLSKRSINLKKKLAAGVACPGVWLRLPSPTVVEIIGGSGVDWVLMDDEHSACNPETLQYMLMALRGTETVALVRVPWNDPVLIKKALDMGWDGVVVPQVNNPEDARRAVEACRYPPQGKRGFGPMRASNYYRDQDDYVRLANEAIFCAIQVEDVRAAERADEIVAVPGIDGLLVGRCDMSGSTGNFLDPGSKEVWDAVRTLFGAARRAGIPYGNAPETLEQNQEMGCQLVVIGEDLGYVRDGVDGSLQAFRRVFR
jgi:2-keto-3-deoxy-L-rhamnonate aldolase RhmA